MTRATAARDAASDAIELRTGYGPGVIGRIAELHGRYYAVAWGSGAGFEIVVAREFCDFVEKYDVARDLLLTAHRDGAMIGSIAMVGERPAKRAEARLRWFIVDPAHQGRGTGKALLNAALDWCRVKGFSKVYLWTVDQLPESRHLYERAGFCVTERHPDDRYSVPLEHVKMELALSPRS